jgi:hypothetical protein
MTSGRRIRPSRRADAADDHPLADLDRFLGLDWLALIDRGLCDAAD